MRFRYSGVLICLTMFIAGGRHAIGADTRQQESPIGKKVSEFALSDFRGKEHKLSDFSDHKLLVVAFLGTECPLVKLYAPRLVELAQQYQKQGVAFIGINSNSQDSITEIAAYARKHKIGFPLLKDSGNVVADQLGAVRTPEVFVLDAERVIRYWGRIDDQYGVGYLRDKPQRKDLEIAVQELLADKKVTQAVTPSTGCHIGRVKVPRKDSAVTYSNQIARILQKRCVECHRDGEIAPFALTDYDEVAGWSEMIAEVVEEQRMPPWHADPRHGKFKNDRALTDEEKELIYQWVDNGAPEGNPHDLPDARQYVTGWQLPQEPDLVIPMRDEPYRVQAEGTVRYQYFRADPGFEEDRWVKAFQVLPGNRAVVHHILVFAGRPGQRNVAGGGALGYLAAYVPGLIAEPFPQGMAKKIPAGSQLVFQVHYTPIGTEQLDKSMIGMVFADPDEVTHQVKTFSAVTNRFVIPPGAPNHRVEASTSEALFDSMLLAMTPHMHLRGKSFLYELVYPDGKKETLLDVPRYDFNWQTSYRLSDKKTLPKGAKIHCVGHYDNSEDNLNNPDPTASISWGDQTWDEMFIGYFDIAFPVDEEQELPFKRPERRRRVGPDELLKRLDKDKNGQIEQKEVPLFLRNRFQRVDANNDGVVTKEELEAAFRNRD